MMELIGRQANVGFQPYGKRLKLCRKLIHDSMRLGQWADILEQESVILLKQFIESPLKGHEAMLFQ